MQREEHSSDFSTHHSPKRHVFIAMLLGSSVFKGQLNLQNNLSALCCMQHNQGILVKQVVVLVVNLKQQSTMHASAAIWCIIFCSLYTTLKKKKYLKIRQIRWTVLIQNSENSKEKYFSKQCCELIFITISNKLPETWFRANFSGKIMKLFTTFKARSSVLCIKNEIHLHEGVLCRQE